MQPVDFTGSNISLHAPEDWDEQQHGPCATVRAEIRPPYVITCWLPTTEERMRLIEGMPLFLWVVGRTMPPSFLTVGGEGEAGADRPVPYTVDELLLGMVRGAGPDGISALDLAKLMEHAGVNNDAAATAMQDALDRGTVTLGKRLQIVIA